ncbi:MAG: hypothetical protein H7A43_03715 [Verrucomicrobia bacterium]|nr:hypothetical protein [Kiritimatiellia bacterium]MCP5487734.1 hypothetical protein [Verrucomicrobiota bacterium]
MTLLRKVFALVLMAVAVGGAGFLLYCGFQGGESGWQDFLTGLGGQRPRVLLGAGLVVLCGLGYLAAAWSSTHRDDTDYLAYETASGSVNISLKALRDFLSHLKDHHEAILQLKPIVSAPSGELDVLLDVKVRAGALIPELCTGLQEEAKSVIRDKIGVSKIRDVRVRVQEIVPADEKRARSSENVEIKAEPAQKTGPETGETPS